MMDATSIAHQGLRKHIKDVAKEHNIEVQWDTTPGGYRCGKYSCRK